MVVVVVLDGGCSQHLEVDTLETLQAHS
jgi:hypothetical protein